MDVVSTLASSLATVTGFTPMRSATSACDHPSRLRLAITKLSILRLAMPQR